MLNLDKKMKRLINEYLDDLREMGQVNMFGAAPLIAEEFDIDKKEARKHLENWMGEYEEGQS